MGIFGRKNKTKTKQPPQEAPRQQQVVKIVGDAKHVTTTHLDAQGRLVQQTQITKLTPAEMEQLGMATPPQQRQEAPPPQHIQVPQVQVPKQQQYPPPPSLVPPQQHPRAPSDIMKTPPSPVSDTQVTNMPAGDERLATIEVTRELVKKFISDIWNRGEVELIPHVCHPSLRFNGHVGMDRVGHEGFARMVTTVRDALTDYHCEIHSMVVETNKAFCRLRFTGKHTGNLLGYPPTGKTVAWMGASEFTCKNGKILKVWELGDVKSLEEQLKSTD